MSRLTGGERIAITKWADEAQSIANGLQGVLHNANQRGDDVLPVCLGQAIADAQRLYRILVNLETIS